VKKLATAILMILLVFNWFGYRVMVDYLQQKADTRLEAHLDNNYYDETQLIEIKVPIHMPYQTSWASYERYDGEVEYNGSFYKYVKRKVANDTLYLKCINNPAKSHLELAKNNFFKNTNDVDQSSKSNSAKSSAVKKAIADYDDYVTRHQFVAVVEDIAVADNAEISQGLPNPGIATPAQPPEFTTFS
jgi:hypothetical protein